VRSLRHAPLTLTQIPQFEDAFFFLNNLRTLK
jgi:hypothetical protein